MFRVQRRVGPDNETAKRMSDQNMRSGGAACVGEDGGDLLNDPANVRGQDGGSLHARPARSYVQTRVNLATSGWTSTQLRDDAATPDSNNTRGPLRPSKPHGRDVRRRRRTLRVAEGWRGAMN